MADDALGVLDALGIAKAHVCGASMGGMIGQALAARAPDRVRSLTLMLTSSGARHLPQASLEVQRALLNRPRRGSGPQDVVGHLEAFFRLIGSPAYPADPKRLRELVEAAVRRAYRPAGQVRQLMAVAAHGDRSAMLARIRCPVHIVHGAVDPLIPSAAAHDLATKIRSATLDVVDGMGHDLPVPLAPRFAQGIVGNASRA
jgi:pimeloyl-ACP methyl ester carboxylesterase